MFLYSKLQGILSLPTYNRGSHTVFINRAGSLEEQPSKTFKNMQQTSEVEQL